MKLFKFVIVFLQIRNYMCIPLEKGRALYLNKLEFPSPKDALCKLYQHLQYIYTEVGKIYSYTRFGKTLNIIKNDFEVHLNILFCNFEGVFIKIRRSSQSSFPNVCCTVTKFGNRSGSRPNFCSYQNTLKSVSAQCDLIFI